MVCGHSPGIPAWHQPYLHVSRRNIHFALFLTSTRSIEFEIPSSPPPDLLEAGFTIFIGLFMGVLLLTMRNPLWASSSVSVAAWLLPTSIDGPFHFTGRTPSKFQVVIGFPSVSRPNLGGLALDLELETGDPVGDAAWNLCSMAE